MKSHVFVASASADFVKLGPIEAQYLHRSFKADDSPRNRQTTQEKTRPWTELSLQEMTPNDVTFQRMMRPLPQPEPPDSFSQGCLQVVMPQTLVSGRQLVCTVKLSPTTGAGGCALARRN